MKPSEQNRKLDVSEEGKGWPTGQVQAGRGKWRGGLQELTEEL